MIDNSRLSFVFLLIVTLTFAEGEIPHQIISDNPAREVTTVESKKLKEKAELDILVNKITPIELIGDVTPEGKTVYKILKIDEEKNILNRVKNKIESNIGGQAEYFVTENLSQILNENKKQSRGRSKRSMPQGIEYKAVENRNMITLIVDTDKPVYIAKLIDGKMENVFRGRNEKQRWQWGETWLDTITREVQLGRSGNVLDDMMYTNFKGYSQYHGHGYRWIGEMNINYYGGYNSVKYHDIYITNKTLPATPYYKTMVWKDNTDANHMWIRESQSYFLPGGRGPGPQWYKKNGGWESSDKNKDISIYDATRVKINTHNYGAVDAFLYKIEPALKLNQPFDKVGLYSVRFLADIGGDKEGIYYYIEFIVKRANKNFTIKPKVLDATGKKIYTEEDTIVQGSENNLPLDWHYRYDDSGERGYNKWGLHIDIQEKPELQIEKINKRSIRVKNRNTNSDVSIWLDREGARGRLKYKINRFGTELETITFKVGHEINGGNIYQDTINLQLEGVKSTHRAVFRVDKRLDGFINAEGKYYKTAQDFGKMTKNYLELMEFESPNINESMSVYKTYYFEHTGNEHAGFNFKYTANPSSNNWHAIGYKKTETARLFEEDFFVYKRSGLGWVSPDIYTSTSRLITVDVQEVENNVYTGKGTFILNLLNTNDEVVFPMGTDVKNEVKKYKNLYTKDTAGVFPNVLGIRSSSKNIVNNLDISVDDGMSSNIQPKNGNLTYEGNGFEIVLRANGNFVIVKKTEETIAPTKVSIDYKYNDVKLGNFTATVINNKTVPIGEATITIDNRLKSLEDNWIFTDGTISNTLSDAGTDYSKLLKIGTNSLSGLESARIVDVHSMEGKVNKGEKVTNSSKGSGYIHFSPFQIRSIQNEGAAPVDLNLTELRTKLVVSKNNSDYSSGTDNIFILFADNDKTYRGNVRETYTGEESESAIATLDLSGVDVGTKLTWSLRANGNATSVENSKVIMKFSKGKLFNVKDIENQEVIINKLKLKKNGVEVAEYKTVNMVSDLLNVQDENNKFTINSDGTLSITKLKLNYDETLKYTIEAYYNETLLGKLDITVTNDTPKNIGELVFNIDKRMKNRLNTMTNWIFSSGEVSQEIGSISRKEYPEVLNLDREYSDITEIAIQDKNVKIRDAISMKERENRDSKLYEVSGVKYRVFTPSPNGDQNTSGAGAIPYGISFQDLGKYSITSIRNTLDVTKEENSFVIELENGKRYSGNIVENFVGKELIEAEAEIDFKRTGHSATWEPESSGESDNSRISMKFVGGDRKVFDSRGTIKSRKSIANKLIIKDSTGVELGKKINEIPGKELEVRLDTTEIFKLDGDGRLTIKGRFQKSRETFVIESYYNDMLLGKLTVTLDTGDALEIKGEDIYNFGKMERGKQYTLSGDIYIKNLGGLKVTKVEVPNSSVMTHGDGMAIIPLELRSGTRILPNNDVRAIIDVIATTDTNQKVGEYNGEFFIAITIDESVAN